MKPYEVEIFDRHYNFRANALLDRGNFVYSYDALSITKNTIPVYNKQITVRETAETGQAGDMTIACSDYIKIKTDDRTYYGIIIDIDINNEVFNLTYTSLLSLFNYYAFITTDDIKFTTIEAYIKRMLEDAFVNNYDTEQNIDNLTVVYTSETTGVMDYNDTTEAYTSINLLNDLIMPAFRDYLIYTDISIEFNSKSMMVTIGERNLSAKAIEADLPNVTRKDFSIRKTSKTTNKLTLIDEYDYQFDEYDYYLHTDYTFDNDASSNRIFPVKNELLTFDSNAITAEQYFYTADKDTSIFNKYVEIERDLSDEEVSELQTAINNLRSYIIASREEWEWTNYVKDEVTEYFNYIINNGLNWGGTLSGTYDPGGWHSFDKRSWEDVTESGLYPYAIAYQITPGQASNIQLYAEKYAPSHQDEYSDKVNLSPAHIVIRDSQGNIIYDSESPTSWRSHPAGVKVLDLVGESGKNTRKVVITGGSGDWVSLFNSWFNSFETLVPYIYPYWSTGGTIKYCYGMHIENTTHVVLRIPCVVKVAATDMNPYDVYYTNYNVIVNYHMTKSTLNSFFEAYKNTDAFKAKFALYKQQNFNAIINGYAKKVFKAIKYTNLIELTVRPDDTMISPLTMDMGQTVNIIHDGVAYNSVLTGREIQRNGLVKLIFGTIRLELTKILNMKGI